MNSPNVRAKRIIVFLSFLLLLANLGLPSANGNSKCPANDPNFGPYNKITILPRFKIVNQPLTIHVVRVEERIERNLAWRVIEIEFMGGVGSTDRLICS